jgi:hypothetical protein
VLDPRNWQVFRPDSEADGATNGDRNVNPAKQSPAPERPAHRPRPS